MATTLTGRRAVVGHDIAADAAALQLLQLVLSHVKEDILLSLGVKMEHICFFDAEPLEKVRGAVLAFPDVRILHDGEMVDGNIFICHRRNGKFDVTSTYSRHGRKALRENLSGAGLEDLLIELADI